MHTERNFMENVLSTILGIAGKSKDHLNARRDLKEMGIRKALHPTLMASGKERILPAKFTMSKDEKLVCCKVLKNIKLPDGIASNISKCVHLEERNIWGLTSHDHHILMQLLLPLAIRKALPKDIVKVLIELTNFFRQLCSKVNHINDLEHIQDRITVILCHLERIFPPSFFDIMEHLPIHLVEEALLAGAVQFRWMYPIERYLCTLKKYVRNRAQFEASIAKGYLMEECMNFCTRYLDDVETKSNRPKRNFDGSNDEGRSTRKGVNITLDRVTWTQCHRYVLMNTDVVQPFIDMHMTELCVKFPRYGYHQLQSVHNDTFHTWFKTHVEEQLNARNSNFSEVIKALAIGPNPRGRSFKAYMINGFHFRTKAFETSRTTQNSGVMLRAKTTSYASRKDRNPIAGEIIYYGVLKNIIQVHYSNRMKFVMFNCDWVDNQRGKMEDYFKFTLVNFDHLMYRDNQMSDEPFIFASQAEQVFYSNDPVEPKWHVVLKMSRRDNYDVYSSLDQADSYSSQTLDDNIPIRDEDNAWVREDVVVDGAIDLGQDEEVVENDETY
ncbi:uncharacterized protein LOC121979771 [Zingiber officinale]|uniref:uncharacterized protein LOC121979771 n=1 Tax=Zingiber officinale TaxID=94328 RepID=UPI001C4B0C11|nr:uncharacterized protein LOC121979771 [Zingiber officinale]